MVTVKDHILNGLLTILVASSVALSAQVWFPSGPQGLPGAKEAQVQSPPPEVDRRMPDVFRPERIVVTRTDGQQAVFQSGTVLHGSLWRLTEGLLSDIRPGYTPPRSDEAETEAAESESVTLFLPVPLRLVEWADQWRWSLFGLTNQLSHIDRVTFVLGKGAGIYLSGPDGVTHQMGPFATTDQRILQEWIKELDAGLFGKHRPLDTKNLSVRLQPGLTVRELVGMPMATVRARKPDQTAEVTRFFPDMSVVRQIDEQDAKSFTDGQRLLRFTTAGVVEFKTVYPTGVTPEFSRGLQVAQEWVATHGGWPQEVILERFTQEPGTLSLRFELRTSGPFPVETGTGALVVDLTADRVSYLRRFPEFTELVFTREQRMVITPEEALRAAAEQAPLALLNEVRDLYPAYLLHQGRQGEPEWALEPVWVIRAGSAKLFVSAAAGLQQRTVRLIR